jgi:hypothetical protein
MRNCACFTFMARRGAEDHGCGSESGDLAHAAHEFVSVEPGQENVADHEVRTNLLQSVKGFFAVGGSDNPGTLQDCRQERAVDWSILDDQNNGICRAGEERVRGSDLSRGADNDGAS